MQEHTTQFYAQQALRNGSRINFLWGLLLLFSMGFLFTGCSKKSHKKHSDDSTYIGGNYLHPQDVENVDGGAKVQYEFTSDVTTREVTVDLAYSDTRLGNNTPIPIESGLPVSSKSFTYQWNTEAVPEGTYSIHLTVHDQTSTSTSTSTGVKTSRILLDEETVAHSGPDESTDVVSNGTGFISEGVFSVVHGPVTNNGYHGDIQLIFQDNCEGCHGAGRGATPVFSDYASTIAIKDLIQYNIRHGGRHAHVGYMPPFFAADNGSRFADYRQLSEKEIRKITQWIGQGTSAGDSTQSRAYTPPTTTTPAGILTEFKTPADFKPVTYASTGKDLYQCFILDTDIKTTQYLMGTLAIPGNPKLVHHVLLFAIPARYNDALFAADQNTAEPGYPCFGAPLNKVSPEIVGGWAPGFRLPAAEDRGFALEPGTRLVVQIHYNFAADPQGSDQTTVQLWLSETRPKALQKTYPIGDLVLNIPAGANHHVETAAYPAAFLIPKDDVGLIYEVLPHAHLLGQEITYTLHRENGTDEELIHIPRWNFQWQQFYHFKTPVKVYPGDSISIRCVYDNSVNNRFQPKNPPIDVHWGNPPPMRCALSSPSQAFNRGFIKHENAVCS